MKFKFTIQQMLWATLVFGFISIAMSAAYRGNIIATGMLIAPVVMVVTFAVLATIYWPCYLISRLLYPPIHTPAPIDFSSGTSSYENDSVVAPSTNADPGDNPTGAPE